ncbi:MAG: glycosyltransferase family 39 protein [Microgenomates group bacterium]|jgi:4-amino-4-deoxy-L-arabinose transferase-like glycosyltransferase
MNHFFKKHNTFIILLLILLLGLFLRTFKLEIFYSFGHDQDLSAWIAKNIIVDHHLRLIGQETSILGLFIGPLFYYLTAISFGIFNMHPLSGAAVTTVLGLFTIISIYWIFKEFFNKNTGLIGAFIYAASPGAVFLDRWVVPTQPTVLWSVWFLYVLFSVLKGNYKILIPLSVLIGLIWHIHIALLPLLILLPIAFFLSEKKNIKDQINLKTLLISSIILIVLVSPFFIFEIKHEFLQTRSLFASMQTNADSYTGINRVIKVFDSSTKSFIAILTFGGEVSGFSLSFVTLLAFTLLSIAIYLGKKGILTTKQLLILFFWYLTVFLAQLISKKAVSEYYFNNLLIILFLILSLFLNHLNNFLKKFPLITILLFIYAASVLIWIFNKPEGFSGFSSKVKSIEYIRDDYVKNSYPCVGINHIEPKENVVSGFRYLFWYYKLNVIKASADIPVYSIVNPWTISGNEVNVRFGDIGVILPTIKKVDSKICSEPDRQLLQLWGFNN